MTEGVPSHKETPPLKIEHHTVIDGKPVTVVREGQKETVVERRPEDPEGLRPDRTSERGSYRGRWPQGK